MKEITHLVFSGCAIRSVCLLGVLRYLQIENIHNNIRNIAGCSMGAFFSLAFALKIPYELLEEKIKKIIKDDNIMSIKNTSFINLFYKNGMESTLDIVNYLKDYIKEKYNMDDMTFLELSKKTGINLYVSSTNINKNINHIFSIDSSPNVSIFKAVASSMTIPYVAFPIEIDGEYYIDGGLTNNFPIKIFDNIPLNNILGIAIKVPEDYKMNEIPKNTEMSLYQYTNQLISLIYLNSSYNTLLKHLNDDILIINESPISSWLPLEITKDSINKIISEKDIDELIVKGFIDISNYMKKNNDKI